MGDDVFMGVFPHPVLPDNLLKNKVLQVSWDYLPANMFMDVLGEVPDALSIELRPAVDEAWALQTCLVSHNDTGGNQYLNFTWRDGIKSFGMYGTTIANGVAHYLNPGALLVPYPTFVSHEVYLIANAAALGAGKYIHALIVGLRMVRKGRLI